MTYKKKNFFNKYMTDADRKRIASIDQNPTALHRKYKFGLTLGHPDIKAKVYIIVYGKDQNEIKDHVTEHLRFFKDKDKKWKVIGIEDLKNKDDVQES